VVAEGRPPFGGRERTRGGRATWRVILGERPSISADYAVMTIDRMPPDVDGVAIIRRLRENPGWHNRFRGSTLKA
jgi:CheY-like chemotaxis protein